MECKCGYVGHPEYGSFQSTEIPHFKPHMRCPECKADGRGVYGGVDMVELAIRYPESCTGFDLQSRHRDRQKVVCLFPGIDFVHYCVYCPVCSYGFASGISFEDYEYIKKLQGQLPAEERV